MDIRKMALELGFLSLIRHGVGGFHWIARDRTSASAWAFSIRSYDKWIGSGDLPYLYTSVYM